MVWLHFWFNCLAPKWIIQTSRLGRWVSCVAVVCWLLNVPTTCKCILGTDLLRPFYVLPHWDRSHWYDSTLKFWRKQYSNLGSSALKANASTTRPARLSVVWARPPVSTTNWIPHSWSDNWSDFEAASKLLERKGGGGRGGGEEIHILLTLLYTCWLIPFP